MDICGIEIELNEQTAEPIWEMLGSVARERLNTVGLVVEAWLGFKADQLAHDEITEGGFAMCRKEANRIIEHVATIVGERGINAVKVYELSSHDLRRLKNIRTWAHETFGITAFGITA